MHRNIGTSSWKDLENKYISMAWSLMKMRSRSKVSATTIFLNRYIRKRYKWANISLNTRNVELSVNTIHICRMKSVWMKTRSIFYRSIMMGPKNCRCIMFTTFISSRTLMIVSKRWAWNCLLYWAKRWALIAINMRSIGPE